MATVVEEIVEKIAGMTVLELSDLKKALEEKFDVTAAAPMMGMAVAAPAAGGGEAAAEEKTSFDVILTEIGGAKLQVIKVVRELTGLGLKEAKDLVDGAPGPIKQGTNREDADKIKAAIEEAGGKAEVK